MRKNIEVYQLIIAVMSVIGVMVTGWVNINSRISIIETRQDNYDSGMQEVRTSLKEISKSNVEILVQLQNKKNR